MNRKLTLAMINAVVIMKESGLLEYLQERSKEILFDMWVNASSHSPDIKDKIRIELGHKVDLVDDVFVQIESILVDEDVRKRDQENAIE